MLSGSCDSWYGHPEGFRVVGVQKRSQGEEQSTGCWSSWCQIHRHRRGLDNLVDVPGHQSAGHACTLVNVEKVRACLPVLQSCTSCGQSLHWCVTLFCAMRRGSDGPCRLQTSGMTKLFYMSGMPCLWPLRACYLNFRCTAH